MLKSKKVRLVNDRVISWTSLSVKLIKFDRANLFSFVHFSTIKLTDSLVSYWQFSKYKPVYLGGISPINVFNSASVIYSIRFYDVI